MKFLQTMALLIVGITLSAQVPQLFKYQAIMRNADGSVLAEKEISLRISILEGTEMLVSVLIEEHIVQTNGNGLVNIEIGSVNTDEFEAINWANGPYYIKIEFDPDGGTDFTDMGTSQLLSVPYALYAVTADSSEYYAESDPVFSVSAANSIDTNDINKWNTSELPILAEQGNLITFDSNNWVAKDIIISTNNTGSSIPINNIQPSLVVRYCIALQGTFPSRNSAEPLLGEIAIFAFNFNPRGWTSCDGQLLAINSYTALFSLLGTTYGGDGRTTFGLPDLRGRVPMHVGNGPGLSSRTMGQKFGTETTSLSVANLPAHKHTVNISYED